MLLELIYVTLFKNFNTMRSRYFVLLVFMCIYCDCFSQNTVRKDHMTIDEIREYNATVGPLMEIPIDYEFEPIMLAVGNPAYQDIQVKHNNSQRTIGKRAATADSYTQRLNSGNDPRRVEVYTSGGIQVERGVSNGGGYKKQIKKRNQEAHAYNAEARRRRNAEIERQNQERRERNAERERQRKIQEEARRRRLYNEGYAMSMAMSAQRTANLHQQADQHAANGIAIKNNHQADGFARYSGYYGSSGNSSFTTVRSREGIIPTRPKNNMVPITQNSTWNSSDFLNIEYQMRERIKNNKNYNDNTTSHELNWEWVMQHPEDSWKWVKQKISNIDDFLDYQQAIDDNKDNFFTQSVRKMYSDAKMSWYNHDISNKIETSLNTVLNTSFDDVRKGLKDKFTGFIKNNATKPIPVLADYVNEKTPFYVPPINMNSVKDAKDLINLSKSITKDTEQSMTGAVDAIYHGNEQEYLSSLEATSRRIAQNTSSTAGKVVERRLGYNPLQPYIEGQQMYDRAKDKSSKYSGKEKTKQFERELIKESGRKAYQEAKDKAIEEFKSNYFN